MLGGPWDWHIRIVLGGPWDWHIIIMLGGPWDCKIIIKALYHCEPNLQSHVCNGSAYSALQLHVDGIRIGV